MPTAEDVRNPKAPQPRSTRAPLEDSRHVEEPLVDLETRGADAARRWSRELDVWEPASFLVGEAEIAAAEQQLDAGHAHPIEAIREAKRMLGHGATATMRLERTGR